jgi:hypothetical protein
VLFQKAAGAIVRRRQVCAAHFVRLYGEHGFSETS